MFGCGEFAPAGGFQGFPRPNLAISGDPSCGEVGPSFAPTHVVCGVIGSGPGVASELFVTQFNGTNWSRFKPMGGRIIRNPSCTGVGESTRAICAVIGTDSAFFAVQFEVTPRDISGVSREPTGVSGFERVEGIIIEDPSCTRLPGSQRAVCGVIGTDEPFGLAIPLSVIIDDGP